MLLESVSTNHFSRFVAGGPDALLTRAMLFRAMSRIPEHGARVLLTLARLYPDSKKLNEICHRL
jgi:hypothetical protein